jgi:Mn-dependent DtxR family transcriptional regulator
MGATNMCQDEILKYLAAHRTGWYTSRQIGKELGISRNSVDMNTQRLRRSNLVRYKRVLRIVAGGKREVTVHAYKPGIIREVNYADND